jgi:aspartyl protease family protein
MAEETGANTSNSDASPSSDGSLEIQREPNGHFYADVDINGTKVHMLIDTGATGVALSREDARSAGIATSIGMPNIVGEGADGGIHGEYVTVDQMSLGSAKAEAVPAIVLNNGGQSLLGQSFLAKFASVEIHGDTMTLR